MLAYTLIVAIAYGIAYAITSTGKNLWRAIVGFALAFFVAWFGGSLLALFLIELMQLGDAQNSFLPMIGRGSWWALLGAGVGVYKARHKLRTGEAAPPLSFPKWVGKAALGIFVVGILAAVVLPAYQDYTKRGIVPIATEPPTKNWENGVISESPATAKPWELQYKSATPSAAEPLDQGERVVIQETRPSFEVRAADLIGRIKSGALSLINARVAPYPRPNEYSIPKANVAKMEGAQTWWRTGDGLFIHIVNSSQFNVASIGIEHASSSCENSSNFSPYVLQLEYFIEPGQEAVVHFQSTPIGASKNLECLNIVEGWAVNHSVGSEGSSEGRNPSMTSNQVAPSESIKEHYRRIYAVHPDADAIYDSPSFKAWLTRYPAYQRIASKGTTQEIIEMFTAYKNQQ
jgi:hypothetical protein